MDCEPLMVIDCEPLMVIEVCSATILRTSDFNVQVTLKNDIEKRVKFGPLITGLGRRCCTDYCM